MMISAHPTAAGLCSQRSRATARPCRGSLVVRSAHRGLDQRTDQSGEPRGLDRRSLLLAAGAAIALPRWAEASEASGAATPLAPYTDPQDGFTLAVPEGWSFAQGSIAGNKSFSGASGARRTLAWFPDGANPRDVNVTIVVTNVSVEFTRLGSFGTALQFGSTLVNSQDRSYLLRGSAWARGQDPVQIAKLVDAAEVSNKYFVEYTVQKPPEQERHLYSAVALGSNALYNRLYTVTGQTLEEYRPQYEATLLAMVKSLTVPPQKA